MTLPPPPENWQPQSDNGQPGDWISLGDVTPIEPKFIERPLLQAATFHLFAGRLGVGKGAIIMRWLARCTNGEMYGHPRNAILLASEEDAALDLVPRLRVAGGDPTRVRMIPNTFLLPRDIDWLRDYTQEFGNVGLIAFDPLSNHIGGTDSNTDEAVRSALQPLAILAGDIDVPMIGVRHISQKEASGGFISRILGSTAWPAVPRVVIGVAQDEGGMLHARALKGNRVRQQEAGVRYRLESAQFLDWRETVVLAIEEGESMVDIDQLLATTRDSASEGARREIVRLIREEGQMESDIVDGRVAEATGVTARTVQKLRMELRDRGWIKHLPVKTADGTVDHWEVVLTSYAPYTAPPGSPTPDHGASGASGSDLGFIASNPLTPTSYIGEASEFPVYGASGDGVSGVSGESEDDSAGNPQNPQIPDFPADDGGIP